MGGPDWAPLHKAAWENQCQVVKILIAAGADLNAKNTVRQSPWHPPCRWALVAVCCLVGSVGQTLWAYFGLRSIEQLVRSG